MSFSVSGGEYQGFDAGDVMVKVLDDEEESTSIEVSASPGTVGEGGNEQAVVLTARLDGAVRSRPTEVSLTVTSDGTATMSGLPDADFSARMPPVLTIPAGAMSGTVTLRVTPESDTVPEGDETILVRLASTDLPIANPDGELHVTIGDDDLEVVLAVDPAMVAEDGGEEEMVVTGRLEAVTGRSSGETTLDTVTEVALTVGGDDATAEPGEDYGATPPGTLTIAAGSATGTATFTLTPVDDDFDEGESETVFVAAASGEGTSGASRVRVTAVPVPITDDETRGLAVNGSEQPVTLTVAEADEAVTVPATVRLSSRPTATVTVTVASITATSTEVAVMPETLTFAPDGWDTAQELAVTVEPDLDAEDGSATVRFAMVGGDYAGLSTNALTVRVDDDEVPSTEVRLSVAPAAVRETPVATPVEVVVTGTLDSGTRTAETRVTLAVEPGTAPASEYTASAPGVLAIPANTLTGTASFTLTPASDDNLDGLQTVLVTGSTDDATGLEVRPAEVTIEDDDLRVDLALSHLEVPEGGGPATVTVTVAPLVPDGDDEGEDPDPRPVPTTVTLNVEAGTATLASAGTPGDFEYTAPRGGPWRSPRAAPRRRCSP